MNAAFELVPTDQPQPFPLALYDTDAELELRYDHWLSKTDNECAAAILTLATVIHAGRQALSSSPSDRLLDLKEAATYLGYDAAGLRKIVKQQKIQYVQNGRGPIKFRRGWLDEFVTANAAGPKDIERSPTQRRATPICSTPSHVFDPSLFLS